MQTESADGTVIGWEEYGAGRPLLLVHGGTTTGAAWDRVRGHLPEGLRVAAMDRRGRGLSGRGPDHSYSLDAEAEDVLAVARALGGDVVVAAHSIGATIVLRALLRAGDELAAAALYEPPLVAMPAEGMRTALDAGEPEEALVAFLRDVVKMPPADIDRRRTSPSWSASVALMWTQRREHDALGELSPDCSQYAAIEQPVRLLVGSEASPHQANGVAELSVVLKRVETVVLEGQGHGALAQAPELVASEITRFLADIGGP